MIAISGSGIGMVIATIAAADSATLAIISRFRPTRSTNRPRNNLDPIDATARSISRSPMNPEARPRSAPSAGRNTRLMSTADSTTQLISSARSRPGIRSSVPIPPLTVSFRSRARAGIRSSRVQPTSRTPSPVAARKIAVVFGMALAPPATTMSPGPMAWPRDAAKV